MRYMGKKYKIHQLREALIRSNDVLKAIESSGLLGNVLMIPQNLKIVTEENKDILEKTEPKPKVPKL